MLYIDTKAFSTEEKSKFASYLLHNKEPRKVFFIGTEKSYGNHLTSYPNSTATLLTKEMVERWYPKTFAEKIDLILLKLSDLADFDGDYVEIASFVYPLFFCLQKGNNEIKKDRDKSLQFNYILDYLEKQDYTEPVGSSHVQLTPKALDRIYELQKTQSSNKNVFVAMKFGKATEDLREKIREGLEGFNVRIMDEIEHNHQIVPEMLYEIRNSRFVIAELSHHNNGAYYEAGYALGLGKEVIHICDKKELKSGLHFDVAQVNTIVYDSIDDIPRLLKKRIEATIL